SLYRQPPHQRDVSWLRMARTEGAGPSQLGRCQTRAPRRPRMQRGLSVALIVLRRTALVDLRTDLFLPDSRSHVLGRMVDGAVAIRGERHRGTVGVLALFGLGIAHAVVISDNHSVAPRELLVLLNLRVEICDVDEDVDLVLFVPNICVSPPLNIEPD